MENVEEEVMEGENVKKKHSFPVPELYKRGSKILQQYSEKRGSLKELIYNTKIRERRRLFHLLSTYLQNADVIEKVLEESKLTEEQPMFNNNLAKVLATDFLVNGATLKSEAKPIQIMKSYAEKLTTAYNGVEIKDPVKSVMPKYTRINTLLITPLEVHDLLRRSGWNFEKYDKSTTTYDDWLGKVKNLEESCYMNDFHIDNLLVFPPNASFYGTTFSNKNLLIIQNKASCIPVHISGVPRGAKVIDACAAPGNKTMHIAACVGQEGNIVAVERDSKRFHLLQTLNEQRGGGEFIECVLSDFTELSDEKYNDAEYIFVDPTCSASGAEFHHDTVSQRRIRQLSDFQFRVLEKALKYPKVKVVIYSTCSVMNLENEDVLSRILDKYGKSFELDDVSSMLPGWKHFGNEPYPFRNLCLRTNVKKDQCTGFFVAKLVRKSLSHTDQNGDCEVNVTDSGTINEVESLSKKSTNLSKKKRKKSLSNNTSVDNVTDVIEVTPAKKSKKKRSLSNNTSVNNVTDDIKVSPRKKSKKKKSLPNNTSVDNVTDDIEVSPPKKKKSLSNNTSVNKVTDDIEVSPPKKSKTKKKRI